MPAFALVTGRERHHLRPEDEVGAAQLQALGVNTEFVPWDGTAPVDWCAYDALCVRHCSGYHLQPERFTAWLAAREAEGIPLLNPAPVVRWNMDKRYLRELEAAGSPIVPTVWLDAPLGPEVQAVMRSQGWRKAVLKPAVSAGAHGTTVVTLEQETLSPASGVIMLQPFLRSVVEDGEWSVIDLGGAYSHTVLKTPKAGDFRVQDIHGGSYAGVEPPAGLRALTDHVRAVLKEKFGILAYARLDAVCEEDTWQIMEVELIEPFLFLETATGAQSRYVRALCERIG